MQASSISNIEQRAIHEEWGLIPTLDEVKTAVKQLKDGKAPGPDGIPPDIFTCLSEELSPALHKLFTEIWDTEQFRMDSGMRIL